MLSEYFLGVDLGQSNDYSAISIIKREDEKMPDIQYIKGYPKPTPDPEKSVYHLGHMERFALGTSYTAVVNETAALMTRQQFKGKASLIIDATGVGAGIFDMFVAAKLAPVGIYFTGGNTARRSDKFFTVPKRDLVFTLLALLEKSRLKIADDLQHAETLRRELTNFKIKINERTGHDSYEHWREKDHDDLLFATAIAVWWARRYRPQARALGRKPRGL